MRLRCGRDVFTEVEARGVSYALVSVEGVRHAEAHAANGSILLLFEPTARDRVLDAVARLDVLALPRVEEARLGEGATELEVAQENNRFATSVTRLVLFRVARRVFLPAPVNLVINLVRSARVIWKGIRTLLSGHLTVEVLDATAIAAALYRQSFDEAGSIGFLLRLSTLLEEHVQSRARLALRDGIVVRAERVWAVVDGRDVEVPMNEVGRDLVLHLTSGSALPVDGVVTDGVGEVDESSLTGEAAPVRKEAGSSVYAGCALVDGDLYVRVVAEPGSARIDAIADMVESSASLKASVQGRAERLADSMVPYSFLAFFAILAVTRNPTRAMGVLMVDYSCAIKLSMPIAVMSAMDEAAEAGVIVRGGKYLEALAEADAAVFDKTGTLTEAAPRVSRVVPLADVPEDELLRLAACIEEHFPHSMARAIVEEARARGIDHAGEPHAEVHYVVAHGISTSVDGVPMRVGSAHFLFEDSGVACPDGLFERMEKIAPTSSVVYVARERTLIGAICIDDPPREDAAPVLARLREQGITRQVMLTGDAEVCARNIAARLGLDEYHAQVLPEDKSGYVERLRDEGHVVLMVGDGINDSPALAAADVSVALSDASDVARAVADVLVLDSSLASIAETRQLSMRLMERIRNDFRLIMAVNSGLIVLGVSGVISLTMAAYLHNATTVVLSAANTRPLLRDHRREPLVAPSVRQIASAGE